jgi:hypothetical protein
MSGEDFKARKALTRRNSTMAKTPTDINWQTVREEEEIKAKGFQLIGEFIFWFSQLEFTIKDRLASALRLPDKYFGAVTTPYDFAVLCTVTQTVLLSNYPPEKKQEIDKVFNDCRKLNEERVRIAHGLWTHAKSGLVARHASRSKLKAEYFYEDPKALSKLTTEAKRLMLEVMQVPGKPKQGTVERVGIEVVMEPKPAERSEGGRAGARQQAPEATAPGAPGLG